MYVHVHAGQHLAVLLDTRGQQELQLRAVEGQELVLAHLILVSAPPYLDAGLHWAMQWRQLLAAPWPNGGGPWLGWLADHLMSPPDRGIFKRGCDGPMGGVSKPSQLHPRQHASLGKFPVQLDGVGAPGLEANELEPE